MSDKEKNTIKNKKKGKTKVKVFQKKKKPPTSESTFIENLQQQYENVIYSLFVGNYVHIYIFLD
ncbi:hypothetical protein DD592_27110 [Enterobacter cloacae complex sp. 2DZ2F20B]|nr:hypothetical protein DD592_27110 [Enterobacter cloacae complex sp. 2DZ2F20B]